MAEKTNRKLRESKSIDINCNIGICMGEKFHYFVAFYTNEYTLGIKNFLIVFSQLHICLMNGDRGSEF